AHLPCGRHSQAGSFCRAGPRGRRPTCEDGDRARSQDSPGSQGRHLRRARRRSELSRVLPSDRLELRLLLTLPSADSASCCSPSGSYRQAKSRSRENQINRRGRTGTPGEFLCELLCPSVVTGLSAAGQSASEPDFPLTLTIAAARWRLSFSPRRRCTQPASVRSRALSLPPRM